MFAELSAGRESYKQGVGDEIRVGYCHADKRNTHQKNISSNWYHTGMMNLPPKLIESLL